MGVKKTLKPVKITVWDYNNAMDGWTIPPDGFEPVKYEVNAWCVGGEYGIKAFFFIERLFCEADGDDGAWCLKSAYDKAWLGEIKEVINSVEG